MVSPVSLLISLVIESGDASWSAAVCGESYTRGLADASARVPGSTGLDWFSSSIGCVELSDKGWSKRNFHD